MNPEALRADALRLLSEHADPRAREAVARGEIVVTTGQTTWDGLRGKVVGYKVGLGLAARDLARLSDAYAVRDSVIAAVAGAMAGDPGSALEDVVFFWSPAAHVETGHYRGGVEGADLRTAIRDYLWAREEIAAEAFARTARFDFEGGAWSIEPTPPADVERAIRACLSALSARVA